MVILQRKGFNNFFKTLNAKGYLIVGPKVSDEAIVYDFLETVDDLPIGITDEQEPGKYRLKKRNDKALFGYVIGPNSWKKYLYPPRTKLWESHQSAQTLEIKENNEDIKPLAFLGVRACELAAILIQDKVFCNGAYVNTSYQKRRDKCLLIAVNCAQAAATCFCTSMNSGPRVGDGSDLTLTEVIEGKDHYFIIEGGTPQGDEIIEALGAEKPDQDLSQKIDEISQQAVDDIQRHLNTTNIKDVLYRNQQHPQWDKTAERCLSCANCTMVCPTCFCSTVEDVTDLTGNHAERWRMWDSCFTMDFSYIHGGHIRSSTKSRYRQWVTHKLASWQDQFDSSGCVGCGRCITWCPVGIDITEEAQIIRENPAEINNQDSENKGA